MKTALDVLNEIDSVIDDLEKSAAGPCIDALIGDVDRETYREAVRRGAELKAIQVLRSHLAERVETNSTPTRRKRKS